ncbi:hypothetical protein CAEBREN_11236 [Caenorhabditis brenneri]|uniref:Uncharacterized protein n=1 Tax=Caenorhabditis brenneri TaxID=135651 RepID=G0ND31_CAEBE|nr:hypothetical protein CAEBREN_11236 [Caenorhabditis brenneri]
MSQIGVFEQNMHVVQEEIVMEEEIDMEDQYSQFQQFSMTTIVNKIDGVQISANILHDDSPTFAIPEFDIQEYLFGDSEDLATIRSNNQAVVNKYVSENSIPSNTDITLSTISTRWMLELNEQEEKDQESDQQYSPVFDNQYQQFSFDMEALDCSSTSSFICEDDEGFTDGDGGFGSDQINY